MCQLMRACRAVLRRTRLPFIATPSPPPSRPTAHRLSFEFPSTISPCYRLVSRLIHCRSSPSLLSPLPPIAMSSSHSHAHTAPEADPAAAPHPHEPGLPHSHRLPTNVRPTHYDLQLTPNLTTFVFQASVSIHLSVQQPTRTVHLNSAELDLKSAEITQGTTKHKATISFNNVRAANDTSH